MKNDYEIAEEPVTPEFVLGVMRAWHRRACEVGEGDDSEPLTFATTVGEWRDAIFDDTSLWWEIAHGLNEEWGIDCPMAEWRAVLKPRSRRTLADVCGLIARHARRPVIRPWRFIGGDCRPAGAFLTVRALLHRRSEEHTSELQSLRHLVCRLLLDK